MQITPEMREIILKGAAKQQAKFIGSGAVISALSGDMSELVNSAGEAGVTMGVISAKDFKSYSETVNLPCSRDEAARLAESAVTGIKGKVELQCPPTENPFVAYCNRGVGVNPALVVAEITGDSSTSQVTLTAFTQNVGLIKKHSCEAAIKKLANKLRN